MDRKEEQDNCIERMFAANREALDRLFAISEEKRRWLSGQRVERIRAGAHLDMGTFIATWSRYAWIVWDGNVQPETELLCNIEAMPD